MQELGAEPRPGVDGAPPFALRGEPNRAWRFAAEAHAGQVRKADGSPYIAHPSAVAALVATHGGDQAMIAAAFLHDVLEDTEVAAEEIYASFGEDVGDLVVALTGDRTISDCERRKGKLRNEVERAGERAGLIYGADKLANSSDLRTVYRLEGEAVGRRHPAPLDLRLRIWRSDAEMVAGMHGRITLIELLEAELDAVEADRRRGRA